MVLTKNKSLKLRTNIKDAVLNNDELVNEIRKAQGENFRFLSVQRQLREESAKLCLPHIQAIIRNGLGLTELQVITTEVYVTKTKKSTNRVGKNTHKKSA